MLDDIDRAFFTRRLLEVRGIASSKNEEAARPYEAVIAEYENRLRELPKAHYTVAA